MNKASGFRFDPDGGLANWYFNAEADKTLNNWQVPEIKVDTVLDVSKLSQAPTGTPGVFDRFKNMLGISDGKFLGMDKGTWSGVTSAVGTGKGLFDIYSGLQQSKLAKDYYNTQMDLQKEQAAMAREEANRIKADRSRLNAGYSGV